MIETTAYYGDGQSARKVLCRLSLVGNSLKLSFNNDGFTFLVWEIQRLHTVQFSGSLLHVHYGDYPHQWLQVEGEMAQKIFEIWSHKKPLSKATLWNNRKLPAFLVTLIVGFLAIAAFSWFVVLPWVSVKASELISVDTEISIGDKLAQTYSTEESQSDSASAILQAFANALKLDEVYPIKTEVLRSNEINAFALPGGRIFVYSGIIEKMKSYEELVALLSHESSHVTHRHSLKSISRSAASSIVLATVFGDVNSVSAGLISKADEIRQLGYSRELETEADTEGLKTMVKNKVSGRGMLQLLELLKKEATEMPALLTYVSTHPDTEARIANISAQADANVKFEQNENLASLFKSLQTQLQADSE